MGRKEFLSKANISGILFMLINLLSLVNYAMEDVFKESGVLSLICYHGSHSKGRAHAGGGRIVLP
jgi:hypothetical protein